MEENEKPLLGDVLKEASKEGKYYMGSRELTRLWNQCPKNLEACKGRDFLPTLEEYFAEAMDQMENNVPGEDTILKDSNFGWKALRLLARRSPYFFSHSNAIMHPLSTYLQFTLEKIAYKKPGKEVSQETQNDTEIDNILTEEEQEQATDGLKHTEQEEFLDDNHVRREHKNITLQQLMFISAKIAPEWTKLALKLGYKQDEIDFFRNENPTPVEQARNLLQIWFEDDEDATLDNLLYILEGLDMQQAAEAVKGEIQNMMES
ncbi:unnamed protein product [Acanthoscelides obtectus]|uniref:Death domain-containing protein n=1 Tax=Acanthoscelides obtectus TaxID=200917 RepID=A0A9P0PF74_ACAOB|nr:unnamed protein product [Acanthoscelides obtectus]CAK1681924.1 THO complex subunit 1 [Acanthoscelides obtectus]